MCTVLRIYKNTKNERKPNQIKKANGNIQRHQKERQRKQKMVWSIYLALVFVYFYFGQKNAKKWRLLTPTARAMTASEHQNSRKRSIYILSCSPLSLSHTHTNCGSKSKCNVLSFWIFFYFACFIVHSKFIPLFEPNSMHQYSASLARMAYRWASFRSTISQS